MSLAVGRVTLQPLSRIDVSSSMQAARFEGSLMSSLEELKAIEQQRLADERNAIARAEELRKQAIVDAERKAREELEAKARAEHEAKLAIERARADAERELRLRVEAAEQAERARQMMVLEQERTAQEMELRRAEVKQKRPTWMVAVTALALVLACVLVVFTVKAVAASVESDKQTEGANKIAEQKRLEVEAMRKELDKIEANLASLDAKVTVALDNVEKARNKAELMAAANELKRLQKEKFDEQVRLNKIRLDQWNKDRVKPVTVDDECARNPLCKKTMK
jgi:hypothetical protein